MLTLNRVCWKTEDGQAVLKGIDLQVKPGKLTVVTGPNGGGKTSLAKVIAGLNEISEGSILLDHIDTVSYTHLLCCGAMRKKGRR